MGISFSKATHENIASIDGKAASYQQDVDQMRTNRLLSFLDALRNMQPAHPFDEGWEDKKHLRIIVAKQNRRA